MPNVYIVNDKLIACTSFIEKLFTLFCYIKCVTVDRVKKNVTINKNILWFISSDKIINFDDIESIVYLYKEYRDKDGDIKDEFTVSFNLLNPSRRIKLFLYSGYNTDVEQSARNYVELLIAFTGKKLTRV